MMSPNHVINSYSKVANSRQERETVIHIEQLKKIIEAVLITPYIKNEKPLSLLIVAKPESGKTSALKMYRENTGIVWLTDCTAYGITRDILPKMVSGEIKTLIIPDLITPLSKSHKTRQGFVAFLNNLIEEGVAKITTYATIWDKEVKANVVTAVTGDVLEDGRHEWAKMGFLSRFIVFSYKYGDSTVAAILNYYSEHGLKIDNVKCRLPTEEVEVKLPKKIADELNPIAREVGKQFELYGIRAKINFRSLLKALAFRNNRNKVTEAEFRQFLELTDYMNFDYHPIR
jgi:hypothetical protein